MSKGRNMREYGIIGYPLQHTLSPFFHTTLFERYNIDARYSPYPIEKEEIPYYIERLRASSLHGLSVTAPYKYLVYSYCDYLSPLAQATGVVNTLSVQDGMIYGDNFDIAGIIKTLQQLEELRNSREAILYSEKGIEKLSNFNIHDTNKMQSKSYLCNETALILGTGATAVSAIVALSHIGVQDIYVAGRSQESLESLQKKYSIIPVYHAFSENEERNNNSSYLSLYDLPLCSILITTIQRGNEPLISYSLLARLLNSMSLVFDVHYSPRYSPLIRDAMQCSAFVSNGYQMFITQALLQFSTWTRIFPREEDIALITQHYHSAY